MKLLSVAIPSYNSESYMRNCIESLLPGGEEVEIIVEDHGKGIVDIEKAKQPFYTTKPELERSGMGFAFMEAFMDHVLVESKPDEGTRVTMTKKVGMREA